MGSERFPRYKAFSEMKGVGHAPGGHPNAPYLKEKEYMVYVWGSERFPRYKTFYEMKGVGHVPGEPPLGSMVYVTKCASS